MASNNPRRNLLRYSLRTFLVVLTLACGLLGWHINNVHRRKKVMSWVRVARYRYEFDDDGVIKADASPPVPEFLWEKLGPDFFATVVSLELIGDRVKDVEAISELTNLESLGLEGTTVSDVSSLKNLTGLRQLHMTGSQVKDVSSLQHLKIPDMRFGLQLRP